MKSDSRSVVRKGESERVRPFSNGTERDWYIATNCERCWKATLDPAVLKMRCKLEEALWDSLDGSCLAPAIAQRMGLHEGREPGDIGRCTEREEHRPGPAVKRGPRPTKGQETLLL